MSKPLIFVLQLIGACLFFLGVAPAMTGGDYGMLIVGLVLLLIAGIGWRKRAKS